MSDRKKKAKRPRRYPAFPVGDSYAPGEMVDTHTKWSPKVTTIRMEEKPVPRNPFPGPDPYAGSH